jgi:hypothetical protein
MTTSVACFVQDVAASEDSSKHARAKGGGCARALGWIIAVTVSREARAMSRAHVSNARRRFVADADVRAIHPSHRANDRTNSQSSPSSWMFGLR